MPPIKEDIRPAKPEEQELARKREEQSALETDLTERELRAASLRAELGAFERRYLHEVGMRYAALDELKAQLAERAAKSQPDTDRAQQAAREARARADETKSASAEEDEQAPKQFKSSPEMKRLYREVAKRIHPDLTSDRDERARRQQLMAEANKAYEQGDESRLSKILNEYEASPETVQGEGPGAELIRVIRRISQVRSRIAEIEAEAQELLRSDLYQLKSRLEEAERDGRDVLKEMVDKVEQQIAQAKARLEHPEQALPCYRADKVNVVAETQEKTAAGKIVHAPGRALAVRSAALVARGLRDLARDSNWLIRKLFSGPTTHLAISATGQTAAISQSAQFGTPRLSIYDIENSTPAVAMAVPNEPPICPPNLPASLAWSPNGKTLVATWGGWQPKLHIFDLQSRTLAGTFGDYANVPKELAWSDGNYFAAAAGGKKASLRVWETRQGSPPISGAAAGEIGIPSCVERQTYEAEFGDDGAFSGYGSTAFSQDGKWIASAVQIQGEWADDSILIAAVPGLREQTAAQAQGHVNALTWTSNGREIVYCAAGQAYRLTVSTRQSESLRAEAELCACHPHLPVCLCYSSWLKNSAKGQLFLIDLNRMSIYDEYPAEGIVDLRWSADGAKAYAVAQDGLAYIYEPPLI